MWERREVGRRGLAVCGALLLAGVVVATALAYSPVGSEIRISNALDVGPDRDTNDAAVAYNPAANEYLVVFSGDEETADNENEIYGQRISASGAPIGGDFRISNVGTDGDDLRDASLPDVVYDSVDNQYLVVWRGDDINDNEFEIWGNRLSATGGSLGAGDGDFRISEAQSIEAARNASNPAVTYNPSAGEYLVVWDADENAGMTDNQFEIWSQRLTASTGNATPSGNDEEITNVASDRDALDPDVAYDSTTNEYYVVYEADDLATAGEVEIFGQRVDATDTNQGSATRLSTVGPNDDPTRDAADPAIAYGSAPNEFLTAWEGDDNAANELSVQAQRVDATGTEQGGDLPVSDVPAGDARDALNPAVAYSSARNEYVVGFDANPTAVGADNGKHEAFVQELSAAGAQIGGDDQISNVLAAGADRNANSPDLAYNTADDELLGAWRDNRITMDDEEIFGRRLAIVPPSPPLPAAAAGAPQAAKKKCKKGFKLKKVKGKKRCVKKKHK